jgi:hypothetical protein
LGVVDSDEHTAGIAFTTVAQYSDAIVAQITGPTSVSTSDSCTTVTWTASATSGSGHSGFSYEWYTGTTLQTTGTTFSKRFCSSGGNRLVTVKVTATASDGHKDTDTHSTSVSFR